MCNTAWGCGAARRLPKHVWEAVAPGGIVVTDGNALFAGGAVCFACAYHLCDFAVDGYMGRMCGRVRYLAATQSACWCC
jgi:hypothetical protein